MRTDLTETKEETGQSAMVFIFFYAGSLLNTVVIKIPPRFYFILFFVAIDKIILKFIQEDKGTRIDKAILEARRVKGRNQLMRSCDFYSYSDQHCVALGNKTDTQMNEMEQRNQKEAQRIIQKGTKMHQWRMVFSKYVTGVTGYPEAIKKKKKNPDLRLPLTQKLAQNESKT